MNSSPVLPGPSDARSNGPWKAVRKLLPWRRPEKGLRPQTLVDVVRWRAEVQPDDLACIFLPDSDGDEVRLSYREIDQQARSIGAWLQEQGAGGSCVLLLYPPGKDYVAAFLGCLYAGAVAVPAYPPRSNQLLARLQLIAEDTKAPLALTTNQVLAKVERQIEGTSDLKRLRWLATDGVVTGHEAQWKRPAITGDSLAFLQYTSGTTARPKGVMISHGNLIYNSELIRNCFETTRATHGLFWLPLYHDMGLMGGVVQPLYGGCPVTFMSPVSFLHRPLRWLEMISRYRATVSGGPNFAYDLCVSKATPEHIAGLDLSSWEIAFTGAEPIRAETMARFSEIFGPCGFRREAFYPCYGLAESVVMVSGGKRLSQPVVRAFAAASLEYNQVAPATDPTTARMLVGCGQTRLDQKIAIVNPDTMTPCAANEVGEIWVTGPSVAKGYWNQPELTQHAFEARLPGSGEGPFLRTGDLGFLSDNDLFVTGRIKDLIIIRGRNYYPQDIELTVEQCHPAVRRGGSAAFAAEVDEQERLVIVLEIDRQHREVNLDEVTDAIRTAVGSEHEIQPHAIVLIKHGTMPRTSSAKIQHHACKAAWQSGTLEVLRSSVLGASPVASASPVTVTRETILAIAEEERRRAATVAIETFLVQQVAQMLGVEPGRIRPDLPLTNLLDSLMTVELKNNAETTLGVVLPASMAGTMQTMTISELASEVFTQIAQSPASHQVLSADTSDRSAYPLSRGQRAIWFLHQLAPESTAYNLTGAVRIRESVSLPALREAFQTLLHRHPALRTTFSAHDGQLMQHIHDDMALRFHVEDAADWSEDQLSDRLSAEARTPFDLEKGPLLRVTVLTRAPQDAVVVLAIHHIVADFWSLAVLMHELGEMYTAYVQGQQPRLASPPVQYTDFVTWQEQVLASAEGDRLRAYWTSELAGDLPVLNLPTDHPRPQAQTFDGAAEAITLSRQLTHQLRELSQRQSVTLYMTLLAAFDTLLYRYTGQEDIIVGTPIAGRNRHELADVVGYFVNPLPIRTQIEGTLRFVDLLQQVKGKVLGALAHQDYPFSQLVEEVQPERDPSRSPVFQSMFVFQRGHLPHERDIAQFAIGADSWAPMKLGQLSVESVAIKHRPAQFDLTLYMAEADERLGAVCEYNTDLFDARTIARMLKHLEMILSGIVANPEASIASLPLLTEQERTQVLVEWNRTQAPLPAICFHEVFERYAMRSPDTLAAIDGHERITYGELNARANRIAQQCRAHGIQSESLVALLAPRSVDLLAAILGVFKAGAAYLPLDPKAPAARHAQVLARSRCALVIASDEHLALVADAVAATEDIASLPVMDLRQALSGSTGADNPAVQVTPRDLAYVIYTSGSTGMPKGAMIEHAGMLNHLLAKVEDLRLTAGDVVAQTASQAFDISVWQFLAPVLAGGQVYIFDEDAVTSPTLLERCDQAGVTTLEIVPSQLAVLLDHLDAVGAARPSLRSLRWLVMTGEPLSPELCRRWLSLYPHIPIINACGPTECSDDVTHYVLQAAPSSDATYVPIGRPIRNTRCYILDGHGQPVPVGVVGEMYCGGIGVGRGYLNDPERTAAAFARDPFSDQQDARLYRTGDLARFLPDGNIQLLGRVDHQVKIRGFRIELGEIEAHLARHPLVRECVVLAREDEPGEKRLAAYVVSPPGSTPEPVDLRDFLARSIPGYMVPAAFVCLDALPLTPNGKIDRRALPVPDWSHAEKRAEYMAPRTPTEEVLVQIWAEVLGVERVGIHDDFFDLGGHSLLATQVISRVREHFDVEIPLRRLFEATTVAQVAEAIDEALDAPPETDMPAGTDMPELKPVPRAAYRMTLE